jgi:hypothetical protein
LIKLLLRAHRFDAILVQRVPFAELAARQKVCRPYFTRVVRLSYLATDITQACSKGASHVIWLQRS